MKFSAQENRHDPDAEDLVTPCRLYFVYMNESQLFITKTLQIKPLKSYYINNLKVSEF